MNLIQILMTPSEVTNKLILCILSFVEALLFYKVFSQVINLKSTKAKKYLYILLTGFTGSLSNIFLTNPYIYIVNIFVLIFSLCIIFKHDLKNTFLAVITVYLFSFISTFIIQILITAFANLSINDIMLIPLYHIIICTLIYTTFYLLYLLLKRKKTIIDFFEVAPKSIIIINLILGIASIFVESYIFSIYKDIFPLNLKIITMSSLIIYFISSMYGLIRTNKLEQTAKDLETEKIYNQTLTLLHDNIRCFKHDFDNIVQILGGYIDLGDMDGLKNYYKSLLEDCKLTNNLNVLNPQTINNPSIYSLLNNKYYKAANDGVTMNFEIFSDLSKINTNIYELSRILGILLDNAIEAARETDEKVINIIIRSDVKKQIFIIENSCIDNNISTTKIFEKGYSTKENNSGIGLWKVHKILSKNTDIDLFTTVKNNKFTQELSVFYSLKKR